MLLEVESTDVARLYHRVLEVTFTGEQGSAFFDPDKEPVIREAVYSYRASPTSKDRRVTAQELNGHGVQFLASDVLTFQWADTSSAGFGLLCPMQVRMVGVWHGSRAHLLYEVHEDHLLGVIHDYE